MVHISANHNLPVVGSSRERGFIIVNHVIQTRVARLSDFSHHDDKGDDDGQNFFAGGSEHRFVTIVTY